MSTTVCGQKFLDKLWIVGGSESVLITNSRLSLMKAQINFDFAAISNKKKKKNICAVINKLEHQVRILQPLKIAIRIDKPKCFRF